MDKRNRNKKRNIIIITIISIICILILTFVSYWQFALKEINNFTTIDFSELKEDHDFIRIRNTEIHYVEKGNGNRTVILIHGFGGGVFTFRNNIDPLVDAGYKIFALDLKGFGFSEKVVGSDYSHIEQAKIVLEFMEKKGIENATIVGHSMGGRIALICYDISPEKFHKIILIDSAGLEKDGPDILSKFITKPLVDIVYYNLLIREDNYKDILSSAYYDKSFVNADILELYLEPFKIKNANLAYLSIVKGNTPYDIEAVLKKINIPVLIIWGENDSWISLENAYRFNDLIKDSKIAIIKESGHVSMEEQPGPVNEEILKFLK